MSTAGTSAPKIRVAAFTAGESIPCARFRVRQYEQALREQGVGLTEFYTAPGAYPPDNKWARPLWAAASLATRVPGIVRSYGYDVVLLQREMLSTLLTLERFTKAPRVFDVDDAIWLNRRGAWAGRLAHLSESIICGNDFVADYFSRWNQNITVLPTAVDTERYRPAAAPFSREHVIIGWSGNRSGFGDLQLVEPALRYILRKYPQMRLRVMADRRPALDLPPEQFEFIPWSQEVEVEVFQSFDIGIMPLRDTAWSRGKCAYKMLLYMSCGAPVVVSPIGMTGQVAQMAPIGAAVDSTEDWIDAFEALLKDRSAALAMGQRGRQVVEDHFSVKVLAPRLATELQRVAARAVAPAARPVHPTPRREKVEVAAREAEPPLRFPFGKNWQRFLRVLSPARIKAAEESLTSMLGQDSLRALTFLDVGSGSGLFSLAARRLGADVVSFDSDPDSVDCAYQLKHQFCLGDARWHIEQGSALDREYLARLGKFDIVYCWGVLHHTGAMWNGLENMAPLVKENGRLFVAIYNDQGKLSDFWRFIKRMYNSMPSLLRFVVLWPYALILAVGMTAKDLWQLRAPRIFFTPVDPRGSSFWTDVVDWAGGYPFEVATPRQIIDFYEQRGFKLDRLVDCGRRLGCNQYIFIRNGKPEQRPLELTNASSEVTSV